MFPLWILLLLWLALVGLFGLMAFISMMQMLRYGIRTTGTVLSTFLFVVTSAAVIGGSGLFFLTVDWSEQIAPLEGLTDSVIFNSTP